MRTTWAWLRSWSARQVSIEPKIQPHQFGRWAREAGRPLSSSPLYGITEEGADQRGQWRDGWNERDRELRR